MSTLSSPHLAIRQINNEYWLNGQDYLDTHPLETKIRVKQHCSDPEFVWEFYVVRTVQGYEHQTWLNGTRVD